jgi:hypothetical protein
MQERLSCGVTVVVWSLLMGTGCSTEGAQESRKAEPAVQPGTQATNADAQLMVEFKKRIDDYLAMREKFKKEVPPLKETKDPAKIRASQEALASKIREARKTAKQGDIFTPETRQLFRRLMYPEVKGREGAATKAAITEESHELKAVSLKVNADYPDSAPLMTVPPNILAALPKLPDDLEYRFVNKTMILLDAHANLIVDFVPGAIQ